jgi:hypothetical protein
MGLRTLGTGDIDVNLAINMADEEHLTDPPRATAKIGKVTVHVGDVDKAPKDSVLADKALIDGCMQRG